MDFMEFRTPKPVDSRSSSSRATGSSDTTFAVNFKPSRSKSDSTSRSSISDKTPPLASLFNTLDQCNSPPPGTNSFDSTPSFLKADTTTIEETPLMEPGTLRRNKSNRSLLTDSTSGSRFSSDLVRNPNTSGLFMGSADPRSILKTSSSKTALSDMVRIVRTSGSSSSKTDSTMKRKTPCRSAMLSRSSGSLTRSGSSLSSTPQNRSSTTPRSSSATRSMTNLTAADSTRSSMLVAIVEGRGFARGEVGMASLDLRSPGMTLSQFADTVNYAKTITKLQILDPLEILMPNTICESSSSSHMVKAIKDYGIPEITSIQRRYFNEKVGLESVKHLCLADDKTVLVELNNKYYCLAAAAALLKYVEYSQNVIYAPASLKVVFKGSEKTMMIDAGTARNLELLDNIEDQRSSMSMFGIINFTKTPGGKRLLRSNLLQPPTDLETILARQQVVSELVQKEALFFGLQSVLRRFPDVDHLLSQCIQIPKKENVQVSENRITQIIILKHVIDLVEPLKAALEGCDSPLLRHHLTLLTDDSFGKVHDIILEKIQADTYLQKDALKMRSEKCFAVKAGVSGLLDVSRRTHTEIVDDISELVTQLSAEHSLPLRVKYSRGRGFFIRFYCAGMDPEPTEDSLPDVFLKVTKTKQVFNFTTLDLIKLNNRVKETLNEIYHIAGSVVADVLDDVREHIGCLHSLSECVSCLDMLVSLAHSCTLSNYVKPDFSDTLAIKSGRHPILDRCEIDPPVPNEVFADSGANFVVITGPNMSGKSTYLRKVALLQIMAQIGCFVPAQFASFRICDQLFSRLSNEDDMESNASTFQLEMNEMNYIIRAVSDSSLVVIDELGRGTSSDEGVGLCWALCEQLIKTRAFTFFTTHFHDLTRLRRFYPNVENYHFKVEENSPREPSQAMSICNSYRTCESSPSSFVYGPSVLTTPSTDTRIPTYWRWV